MKESNTHVTSFIHSSLVGFNMFNMYVHYAVGFNMNAEFFSNRTMHAQA